jgi:hypothetical protein
MSLPAKAASGPLTIATTGHVGLNVTDLSRSIRFYRDVFGFEADLGVPLIYDEILPHMPGMSSGSISFADPDGTRVEVCTASGLDALPALEHGEPSCGFF